MPLCWSFGSLEEGSLVPIIIKVIAAATVALMLHTLPAAALPQSALPTSPGLPGNVEDLLPKAGVERFEVTVRGTQSAHLNFVYDTSPAIDCSLEGAGTLDEFWEYARGRGIVISFRKLGPGVVILQRAGRSLGDAALATSGSVTREATGSVQTRTPTICTSFPLSGPSCGQRFPVHSDLRLGWSKGKLTLEQSSTAARTKNPALACGMTEVWNFDQFTVPFPYLSDQRGALSISQIFDSKRNLKVELRDRFLESVSDFPGYTSLNERLGGSTTVTLKRLGRG